MSFGSKKPFCIDPKGNNIEPIISKIKSLCNPNEKTKIVLCLDPYQKLGLSNDKIASNDITFLDMTAIAHELSRQDNLEVFMGNDVVNDLRKVKKLPTKVIKSDVELLIPEESFSNKDDISKPILDKIKDNGLNYRIFDAQTASYEENSSNIIMFSGEKGDEFWEFLNKLGAKQLLKDKILIMYSCNDEGDIYKYSQLIKNMEFRILSGFLIKLTQAQLKLCF